jgi:tetratricopeptide (TPR) repeat protein
MSPVLIISLFYSEIAENFKNQGNDCFKAGKLKYQDAVSFYTRAIDTDCSDQALMEACYANRAAVNLELGNYGKVLRDCAKCLELNPSNVKALYRSARGLFQLDRPDEAYDCCVHCLAVDPDNIPVQQLQAKIKKRQDDLKQRAAAKAERLQKEQQAKQQKADALERRRITINVQDKAMYDAAAIQYDADSDTVTWPVFFLYPEHKESDYIQQFDENNTFQDHLDVMLENPAPWDPDHLYSPANVNVYFENTQGSKPTLLKVGNKLPLAKVLALDQYVITNGVPSFIILPKSGEFRDQFLEKYKKSTK